MIDKFDSWKNWSVFTERDCYGENKAEGQRHAKWTKAKQDWNWDWEWTLHKHFHEHVFNNDKHSLSIEMKIKLHTLRVQSTLGIDTVFGVREKMSNAALIVAQLVILCSLSVRVCAFITCLPQLTLYYLKYKLHYCVFTGNISFPYRSWNKCTRKKSRSILQMHNEFLALDAYCSRMVWIKFFFQMPKPSGLKCNVQQVHKLVFDV